MIANPRRLAMAHARLREAAENLKQATADLEAAEREHRLAGELVEELEASPMHRDAENYK